MPEPEVTVVEAPPSPPAEPEVTEQPAPSAGAEPETPQDAELSPEEKEKPGFRGLQRKLDEQTKRAHRAEARAETLEKLLVGRGANGDKSPTPAAETPLKEPDPDEYDGSEGKTLKDYLKDARAYDREVLRREVRDELQKTETEREKRSEQEIVAQEWDEREEAFKAKSPDFDDVVNEAMNAEGSGILQVTKGPAQGTVGHAIQVSENGPALLYYLAQHPEEARSIIAMQPSRAMLAMGRIEARLAPDNAGGDQKPPMTRAPKPPSPVRKAAAVDTNELRDDLSPEEWARRFRKKQEMKNG